MDRPYCSQNLQLLGNKDSRVSTDNIVTLAGSRWMEIAKNINRGILWEGPLLTNDDVLK